MPVGEKSFNRCQGLNAVLWSVYLVKIDDKHIKIKCSFVLHRKFCNFLFSITQLSSKIVKIKGQSVKGTRYEVKCKE